MPLPRYLAHHARIVDQALRLLVPTAGTRPATLHRAMRYSLLAGGKRMRPILTLAAVETCGGYPEPALPLAAAVECIHTYSLIHDDLPCMDDDDFRRGKPTSHKVFGEGMAVLAGDALLTQAFQLAASAPPSRRHHAAAYVAELATAAGSLHLIAGQVADLEGEGSRPTLAQLRWIHERKTGALIATSLVLGAMSAGAPPREIARLRSFGLALGLAFQIIDDILDVTQPSEKLGKSAGKDARARKATYPALLGLDGAQREAARWTRRAHAAIAPFGARALRLRQITDHLLSRDH
jgi:geranylgeranyl diphosphate synthase type II